jgi:two-component system CheB/CheR fusion protein
VYDDGVPRWVNDRERLLALLPVRAAAAEEAGLCAAAALPVRFGRDVIAVLELFSDQPHEPNELLENLMDDVSAQIGKVLERERATAQIADLLWREQQGLLHTLHDSLGQTLTGLGMLSAGLSQQLAGNPAAADTAREIAQQARVALEQIRQLYRGMYPLEIRPEGLVPSLRALAATTEAFHGIRVRVDADVPAPIHDSRIATQLYRIAQEAVTNAVKHARAQAIRIDVTVAAAVVKLRIVDDGAGMPTGDVTGDGLGLRIMRYRAASIGAALSIEAAPGGGTIVSCTLREPPAAALSGGRP